MGEKIDKLPFNLTYKGDVYGSGGDGLMSHFVDIDGNHYFE